RLPARNRAPPTLGRNRKCFRRGVGHFISGVPGSVYHRRSQLQPWKPVIDSGFTNRDHSFNGATVLQPWKQHNGPRLSPVSASSFNGATVLQPGKQPEPWRFSVPQRCLQRSHGTSTVEAPIAVEPFSFPLKPSTEPR